MENPDIRPTNSSPSSLAPPPPAVAAEEPEPKRLKMSTTTSDDEECTTATGIRKRYKRPKIAIFVVYCGVGYQGMQKNPGDKTIEGDLEEALHVFGAVPEQDCGIPNRYDWADSARTDKGVSAVGQIVSGQFYFDPPGLIDCLNSNLSPQIRIFGYKRATASFNAKKFCDQGRYVYLIPLFALDPSCHRNRESVLASLGSENELVKCLECFERGHKVAVELIGKPKLELEAVDSEAGISLNGDAVLKSGVTEDIGVSLNKDDGNNLNKESSNNVNSEIGLETLVPAQVEGTHLNGGSVDNSSILGEAKLNGEPSKGSKLCYGEKERERFNRILNYL